MNIDTYKKTVRSLGGARPTSLCSPTDKIRDMVIKRPAAMHACTHARTRTRTHACTHSHTHARMHARTHTHTHTHAYTHTRIHKHPRIHKNTHTPKHTQTYISIYISLYLSSVHIESSSLECCSDSGTRVIIILSHEMRFLQNALRGEAAGRNEKSADEMNQLPFSHYPEIIHQQNIAINVYVYL